jgi:hypothetical protein
MPQFEELDREELTKSFSMEELKQVVFSLKHNSAPGRNGITDEFYQHFGEVIKYDLK